MHSWRLPPRPKDVHFHVIVFYFRLVLGGRKGWNTLGKGSDRLWAAVDGVWKEGGGVTQGTSLPWQPAGSCGEPLWHQGSVSALK